MTTWCPNCIYYNTQSHVFEIKLLINTSRWHSTPHFGGINRGRHMIKCNFVHLMEAAIEKFAESSVKTILTPLIACMEEIHVQLLLGLVILNWYAPLDTKPIYSDYCCMIVSNGARTQERMLNTFHDHMRCLPGISSIALSDKVSNSENLSLACLMGGSQKISSQRAALLRWGQYRPHLRFKDLLERHVQGLDTIGWTLPHKQNGGKCLPRLECWSQAPVGSGRESSPLKVPPKKHTRPPIMITCRLMHPLQ